MRTLPLAVIALFLLLLSGCGSGAYPLTFDSNPQGATVICNSMGNIGYTPATVYYDGGKKKMKSAPVDATLDVSECSARWASGAQANYQGVIPVRELPQAFPNGVSITVQRPNVPGLQEDNHFALQVHQMRTAQQQAAAVQQQAVAMQQAAAAAQQANVNQAVQNMNMNNQLWQLNNNLFMMRRGLY